MKKAIAIVLCFAILAFVAFPQKSEAVFAEGLVVGGVAVMTAALAVDTLIVAAGGAGMMDAIRKTAQNNNMSVSQFMSNEYADFRNNNGENLNASLRRFVNGAYFNPAGQLILSFELGHYISRFLNQLWSKDGGNVIENATPTGGVYPRSWSNASGTINLYNPVSTSFFNTVSTKGWHYNPNNYITKGGKTYYIGHFNYNFINYYASNIYFTRAVVNGVNKLYAISSDTIETPYGINTRSSFMGFVYPQQNTNGGYNGAFKFFNPDVGNTVAVAFQRGWWKSTTFAYDTAVLPDIPLSTATEDEILAVTLDDIKGNADTYDENPDVYNLPQDQEDHTSVLDIPEVILPDSAADVGAGTINIGDYLQSLANALATDATVDLTVTLENEATADIPLTLEQDIPVDAVAENDVAVGDKEEVATETDASALEPYMLNLTDFFPFCIPFDIYKMLNLFSASAQAPHFQWRIYAPNIVDYMIDIDLSGFDQAAQVLRTVELIAFAVALAFATKKIIQGGD